MSHIAACECTLGKIDMGVFQEAIALVAKAMGGRVGDGIDSYDEGKNVKTWAGKKIIASIRTKDLPQGIGFILEKTGKISYVTDKLYEAETVTGLNRSDARFNPLMKKSEKGFSALQSGIEEVYTLLAVQGALKALGYEISDVRKDEGMTIVQGELA